MVASLMTFPEHGIVVSVTSNISNADTFSLVVRTAEPFARQANRLSVYPGFGASPRMRSIIGFHSVEV
jgi:hypothetical protein